MDNIEILSTEVATLMARISKLEAALKGSMMQSAVMREFGDVYNSASNLSAAIRGMRNEAVPTSQKDKDDEYESRHDSFGSIQISRVSGHTKLFGSLLSRHQHFIRIRVARSSARYHKRDGTMYTWPDHSRKGTIVEFSMSAAQFAEAITTMNVAAGVPVTLNNIQGRDIERVPEDHENSATRILEEFRERMSQVPNDGPKLADQIQALISQYGLSKAKQAEIMDRVGALAYNHKANAEYTLAMFNESAEKTVTAAKSEADAVFTSITHNLGLARLAEVQETAKLTKGE
jgi:hypothetical protein